MKKNYRKLLALLLTIAVLTIALPITAFALWDQKTVTLQSGQYIDLPSFTADANYIGFEMTGTKSDGTACNGNFTVSLRRLGSSICSATTLADGSLTKKDWVSIVNGYTYNFRIANNSIYPLTITLTWYTWN